MTLQVNHARNSGEIDRFVFHSLLMFPGEPVLNKVFCLKRADITKTWNGAWENGHGKLKIGIERWVTGE